MNTDDGTLQTSIEHTLLDSSFERFDAKNAAAKLLPVIKEHVSNVVAQERETWAAEQDAATAGGGQTRKGMTTTGNQGR